MVYRRVIAILVLVLALFLLGYTGYRYTSLRSSVSFSEDPDEAFRKAMEDLERETARVRKEIARLGIQFIGDDVPTLGLVEDAVESMENHGLDIESYSILDQDDKRGLDVRFTGTSESLIQFLADMENREYLVNVENMTIIRQQYGLSVSLRLLAATPELITNIDRTEYSPTEHPVDIAGDILGPTNAPINISEPQTAVSQNDKSAPRWMTFVGEYTSSDGQRIYAVQDGQSGMIRNLYSGYDDGEWSLKSEHDEWIRIAIGDDTFRLEASQ